MAPDSRPARESALYAFLVGCFGVGFLVIRAEVLWQRSWRPVRATGERPEMTPGARQRLVVALGITVLSWGFAIAYLFYRTEPLAPLLAGFSVLSLFACMILIGRVCGPSQMREIRKSILLAASLLICFVAVVAFRSRVTAPGQTTAWLVSASLTCIATPAALLLLRPESGIRNS